ncbi:aromatic amino acid transaminase [Candidatus Spongiihabitans sp.]|uniref:amino acid aminotransferase n=1 Tax=Candidatus Spongiihabitans sp. TaxID=3101308 RepID=UPI003C7B118F
MFEKFEAAPQDPIIKLIGMYRDDPRVEKIDVGVGVFRDAEGQTPIMAAVTIAEQRLHEAQTTKAYVGLAGDEVFNGQIADLVFGRSGVRDRVRAVQTPGGCGALRMLSDMLFRIASERTVWVSDPTWGNHYPIFRQSGFNVAAYPYLDRETKTVNRDALLGKLSTLGQNDIVVLHGCCHNPSGAELAPRDWDEIAALSAKNGFLAFVDFAYQGFGDSLEEDAYGIRALALAVESMVVASSCSKNFGLYRDRVGCALLLGGSPEVSDIARGHLLSTARSSYSMPPDHGAAIVARIMTDAALRQSWEDELTGMRRRMRSIRKKMSAILRAKSGGARWDFIADHRGMFSLLILDDSQVDRLRRDYAVYAVAGGRINIAGIKDDDQLARFADALVAVVAPAHPAPAT